MSRWRRMHPADRVFLNRIIGLVGVSLAMAFFYIATWTGENDLDIGERWTLTGVITFLGTVCIAFCVGI